jgi:8-oxo-dGTP diphosphatase
MTVSFRKKPGRPERAHRDPHAREEQAFLAAYRPGHYPRPAVTVDIVVFTLVDATLKVLLVKRGEHPFKGRWALPGGFVRVKEDASDQGEDLDAAAARELAEETGLGTERVSVKQLRAFGKAGRDPRMRVVSVAYYALVRPALVAFVKAGGDASRAAWHPVDEARSLTLAFDHDEILACALERIRRDVDDLAGELVPETFSIAELRSVHEAILGHPVDPGNFRKRFLRRIEDSEIGLAPGKRITASKPAKVYRFLRDTSVTTTGN